MAPPGPVLRLAGITLPAVQHLPGVDHPGMTLVDEGVVIQAVAATDGHPLVLDNLQRRYGGGPCFDAATDHRTCRIDT